MDAATFRAAPQNQIEAQRSGFDWEAKNNPRPAKKPRRKAGICAIRGCLELVGEGGFAPM